MMKKILFTTAGMLLAGAALAQNPQTMKPYSDQLPASGRGNARVAYRGRAIDRMIYEFMEEQGIPGMTLAIVQAPYIPRVAGYGVTDLAKNTLASVKTLWPAGPISQGFAAVAAVQLHERNKLDLTDPIGKYLTKIPAAWKNITVLQLLQHSTGIADYRAQPGFDPAQDYRPGELLATVSALPLAFEPGTDVKQSATNFLLLASVIERASGMSYHDFVRKHQIDYLGLKETFFGEELPKVRQEDVTTTANVHQTFKRDPAYIDPAETTTGYVARDGRLEPVQAVSSTAMIGFSDIWASAENISHWDIALAGGVLIEKAENRDLLYKPTRLANGKTVPAVAGWQFYNHPGLMDIKGSVPGHSAFLSRFTDASELVCVTLLANREGVDLTNLARRIAAAFDPAHLGSGANEERLYVVESQFSADQTMERIERTLSQEGIPVFARFDHALNAREAGLELRPNRVVVFGSPKVGTRLMQVDPSVSIELPLRISVWEDERGSVWAAFPQMRALAAEYGLEGEEVIGKMQQLLERIVAQATSVY